MNNNIFREHVGNIADLLLKPANITNTKKIRHELLKLKESGAIKNDKVYSDYHEALNDPFARNVFLCYSALNDAIEIANYCVEQGYALDMDVDLFTECFYRLAGFAGVNLDPSK